MTKGMVLHLMPDEKFIDYFIEHSETVYPSYSTFWVIKNDYSKEFIHVKSSNVISINWIPSNFLGLIDEANKFDILILHSFFFKDLDLFIKGINKKIKIVWMFWGGDGYKYSPNTNQWYLNGTIKYRKKKLREGVNKFRGYLREINLYRLQIKESYQTKDLIRRVNICVTWIKDDFKMLRHINPDMQWISYSYFSAEQMGLCDIKFSPLNLNRIWLGNSATDTNNHIDSLDYLKEIDFQGEILVPLSYGSSLYRDDIINYGSKIFGKKFKPIVDFIPLNEYQNLIDSCGIVWMNHIRQQAAGNVIASLAMGKVVILNDKSNLYRSLIDWGIRVKTKDWLKTCKVPSVRDFEINKDIILKRLSVENCLLGLKNIYFNNG